MLLNRLNKVWSRQPIVTVSWLFVAMVWPLFASPNVLLLPGRRSGQEGTLRTVTTDPRGTRFIGTMLLINHLKADQFVVPLGGEVFAVAFWCAFQHMS